MGHQEDYLSKIITTRLDRIESILLEHKDSSHRDHLALIERITRIEQSRLTYSKIITMLFGAIGGILSFIASLLFKHGS